MTLARLALVVAMYVSLDVSNPMMPGALTFGVDGSVEARQSERFRDHDHDAAPIARTPEPERPEPSDGPVTLRRLVAPVTSWSRPAHVTRSHLSLPTAASFSEDH